jgi:hypothetical protein
MPSGVEHRSVTTNGISMHIAEQGEGPLVLLLPRLAGIDGALARGADPSADALHSRNARSGHRRTMGETAMKQMPAIVPGLRRQLLIDGAGHWIQQQRSNEVNDALIDFLRAVAPVGR